MKLRRGTKVWIPGIVTWIVGRNARVQAIRPHPSCGDKIDASRVSDAELPRRMVRLRTTRKK